MFRKFIFLVLIFAKTNQGDSFCEVDDSCTLGDGSEGLAVLSKDCPYFLSLANEERKRIRPCGFVGLAALSCCPQLEFGERSYIGKAEAACIGFGKKPIDSGEVIERIINGNHSEIGEFPHFASLGYQGTEDRDFSFECGGALISARFVITAAHCGRKSRQPKIVRLGRTSKDLTDLKDTSKHVDVNVKTVYVHPKYNVSQKYYDIALLELARPLKFSRTIWPACLQLNNNYNPKELTIAGFGRNSVIDARMTSNWLMKGFVDETPMENCRAEYARAMKGQPIKKMSRGITDDLICAKNKRKQVDTCQGDSGSALQYFENDVWYVVGLTSFGISCGHSLSSFYTRVPSYIDWIEGIVWKN